ncbi:MAG: copper resistance system multicopper oxidase [Alphaproteobacteria bacterium]|nr:copper resistance system multicopper oxidase [Alphaproteobacteria bacterium]MBU1514532.1 copper resistance system multicopper oxidase [Alphaproteobacteria bacterium]MBU2096836.1 copper resistance system multicopper oxidase [Alphaproteobacteria bacterium]MBU2153463.1 copper resistance system multicopper oxidase [Alphaproteobacteria bacterium]MBU2306032.1 copper resistance system multicopper oxidase [Alphaproteobacteria bacterium]
MIRLPRRDFLAGAAALAALRPDWAESATPGLSTLPTLSGETIRLTIDHAPVRVDGKAGHAVAINGMMPGPLIRLREGQKVRLEVENRLKEDTSIHWHGLLVPFQMDGVPGVSFPGIRPGETFAYEFPIIQSGTYWYHSHSGLQEQMGHYAPIVIDPAGVDPVAFDREHVIVLSDYSFTHPHVLFQRLKSQSGVFNFQKQTVGGLLAGRDQTLAERREWAAMRMDPTDISDITGAAYKFLINGHGPNDNWTGLFKPGERVRLRFVNAAAQTIFNVRIPGLKLTMVASDGQHVRPVTVDEFQIGNAETYDVIVEPQADRAFTLVAEAVDRSGLARATLAPRPGMTAEVPPLRTRPLTTMRDMGMDMSGGGEAGGGVDHAAMGHAMPAAAPKAEPGMAAPKPRGSDVMGHSMAMMDASKAPQVKLGPGVQMIAPMPVDRTGEPGQGLESVGHRVLVYTDLIALEPNPDTRAPSRAMEIRLTGNMERFMWGFDGKKFADRPAPYTLTAGERVRITLVNDTMMTHPIHMHGHFFELVHGPVGHMPRKHTVNVLPGGKVTFDVTGEAGDWAFHCHMLYHMHAGMFQVFSVRPAPGAGA